MLTFASLVAKAAKLTGLAASQIHLAVVIGAGVVAALAIFCLVRSCSRRPDSRMRDDARLHGAIARCFQESETEQPDVAGKRSLSPSTAAERARREDEAYRRWLN